MTLIIASTYTAAFPIFVQLLFQFRTVLDMTKTQQVHIML